METIKAEELKRILAGAIGTPVINVLDHDTYRDRHIPATINIPLDADDFVERVGHHVNDRTDPVVVYCASDKCNASEKAARKLEEAGFTRVRDFAPGIEGWEAAGYRLEGRHESTGR
jgi:rhodanese-related sulfurtransferase